MRSRYRCDGLVRAGVGVAKLERPNALRAADDGRRDEQARGRSQERRLDADRLCHRPHERIAGGHEQQRAEPVVRAHPSQSVRRDVPLQRRVPERVPERDGARSAQRACRHGNRGRAERQQDELRHPERQEHEDGEERPAWNEMEPDDAADDGADSRGREDQRPARRSTERLPRDLARA